MTLDVSQRIGDLPPWRARVRVARAMLALLASPDRRYAVRWLASQRPGWMLEHHQPWLNFAVTEFLAAELKRRSAPLVFEWGSGASTLFWMDHGARVTSIEHDAEWHAEISALLAPAAPVDYRLVEPVANIHGPGLDPADPQLCISADPRFHGHDFSNYVSQVDELADGSLDMVVVDGRSRPACLMRAVPKVRPGGLLVLDNADRDYYLSRTVSALAGFDRVSFVGHCPGILELTRTDVFVRRCGG